MHSIVPVKVSKTTLFFFFYFTLLDWYKSPDLWGDKPHGNEIEKSHFQRENYTIFEDRHTKKTTWWDSLSINITGLQILCISKGTEATHSLPVFAESDQRLLLQLIETSGIHLHSAVQPFCLETQINPEFSGGRGTSTVVGRPWLLGYGLSSLEGAVGWCGCVPSSIWSGWLLILIGFYTHFPKRIQRMFTEGLKLIVTSLTWALAAESGCVIQTQVKGS